MPPDPQLLERFHRALVREIRRSRPDYLKRSFPIEEIYEELVPYRTHRNVIGVAMNGDYEDALLRLLGGEGEYLVLQSDTALLAIQKELASPNPNPSRFRDFGNADVRLNPARIGSGSREPGSVNGGAAPAGKVPVTTLAPTGTAESPVEETPAASGTERKAAPLAGVKAPEPRGRGSTIRPGGGGNAPEPVGGSKVPGSVAPERSKQGATSGNIVPVQTLRPASTRPAAPPAEVRPRRTVRRTCRWCEAGLPDRDPLNYCPFCGRSLRLIPCRSCGEALEASWRFCAACGAEVAAR